MHSDWLDVIGRDEYQPLAHSFYYRSAYHSVGYRTLGLAFNFLRNTNGSPSSRTLDVAQIDAIFTVRWRTDGQLLMN